MRDGLLTTIRSNHPIIHCITNYVTANDCANILLACGASPVMADAPQESAEITAGSSALVLNLGTLSESRLQAMILSGKQANRMQIPVVFDPVGVGASAFRMESAKKLLSLVQMTAIRGNLSEIQALIGFREHEPGVDAADSGTENAAQYAKTAAWHFECNVILSGAEDIITDGLRVCRSHRGDPILKTITGAGCMLSALTAAFLTAENSLAGCTAAVHAMGSAGEAAASRMTEQDGNATCRNYLIDAVYRMKDQEADIWKK